MATIRKGVLHEVRHIGVRHMRTTDPVDADTVFEAASLSKPLVAYAVLHLVDAGRIDLDEPLSRIVPAVIPNDHEAAAITARHVLTHTTGLPNWRREEYPLRIYFPPGSRFSYSGEGFLYLQSAVEHLTGEPLDNLMRKLVFEPLGMERSAYTWEERFEENFATAHDDKGNAYEKFKPSVANAAYSLHTTAVEYSRFLVATIGNSGLSKPIPAGTRAGRTVRGIGEHSSGNRSRCCLVPWVGSRGRDRNVVPLGLKSGRVGICRR